MIGSFPNSNYKRDRNIFERAFGSYVDVDIIYPDLQITGKLFTDWRRDCHDCCINTQY